MEEKIYKELNKILGEPTYESKSGKKIIGSRWNISLKEKSKITQIMLKANIFEL